MVRKPKGKGKKGNGDASGDNNTDTNNDIRTATTKVNSFKPGISCIGKICFNEDGGFTVKIPRDADPKCAYLTTETILQGKKINYEIESREEETKTEEEERKDKEELLNNLRQTIKDIEAEVAADKKE